MRQTAWCLFALLCGTPAFAQSAYVGAGVGADLFRPGRVEVRGADDWSAAGETIAFSARVGTAVTDRWGVELEFTRAGNIEREMQRGFPVPLLARQAVPQFESTIRLTRRNATLDAVAWVAQTLSGRVDLVYVGGIAFTRIVEEMDFELTRRAGLAPIVVPTSTRTTTYGAGPVAGLEARVQLTARAILIPGVRLHGIGGDAGGGWLLRPSVALGWRF
jgi:hypothetical protein